MKALSKSTFLKFNFMWGVGVGYLDEMSGEFFVPMIEKLREVIAELLDKKDYVALGAHALHAEAFEPGIAHIKPQMDEHIAKTSHAIASALRSQYYAERVEEIKNNLAVWQKKQGVCTSKIERLERELAVVKEAPHEVLEDFDPSTVGYQEGFEILKRKSAAFEKSTRQYVIPGEINDALRELNGYQ
jgi:hypothetical protein